VWYDPYMGGTTHIWVFRRQMVNYCATAVPWKGYVFKHNYVN